MLEDLPLSKRNKMRKKRYLVKRRSCLAKMGRIKSHTSLILALQVLTGRFGLPALTFTGRGAKRHLQRAEREGFHTQQLLKKARSRSL